MLGRMDACPLVKVVKCSAANKSIREEFAAAKSVKIGSYTITLAEAADNAAAQAVEADFVQTSVDLVDGFKNRY